MLRGCLIESHQAALPVQGHSCGRLSTYWDAESRVLPQLSGRPGGIPLPVAIDAAPALCYDERTSRTGRDRGDLS